MAETVSPLSRSRKNVLPVPPHLSVKPAEIRSADTSSGSQWSTPISSGTQGLRGRISHPVTCPISTTPGNDIAPSAIGVDQRHSPSRVYRATRGSGTDVGRLRSPRTRREPFTQEMTNPSSRRTNAPISSSGRHSGRAVGPVDPSGRTPSRSRPSRSGQASHGVPSVGGRDCGLPVSRGRSAATPPCLKGRPL